MPDNTLWNHILSALQKTWATETYTEWIAAANPQFISFADDTLTIACKGTQVAISTKLVAHEFQKILQGMGFADALVKFTPEETVVQIKADPYDDAYQQIARPDRALYLSGYFKRWLRYLGPDLAWMYASFRQAAYMDGGRAGHFSGRFTGAEIAARAGIGDRTYWDRIENPKTWEKLKGLVALEDSGSLWDLSSGKPRKMPRSFSVAMTLPLTPFDSASLRKWLIENTEKCGGVEGVLRVAANTPVDELLPAQTETLSEPLTVRALVQELFGEQLDAKLLKALASAVQNLIMPSSDQIKITLYFMEHILPHIGTAAGWLLTLLRDRCFSDGHEMRNRVLVRGGYGEIAEWLGLQGARRARTVWDWLNAKHSANHAEAGKYKNPASRIYLCEDGKDGTLPDFEKQPRAFFVLLDEIPRELLEASLTRKGWLADLIEHGKVTAIPNDAICTIGMTRFAALSADPNDAICTIAVTRSAYPVDAICTIAMTRFAQSVDATCRVKSSLTPKPNSITPPTQLPAAAEESAPASQPAAVPAESGGRAGWSFSQIAQNNTLNRKALDALTAKFSDEQVLANKFLAWVLYAYSPQGKGLTDTSGVSKAVKGLLAAQPEFAPQKFERLVKLGPQQLQDLFDHDYAREDLGKSVEANIYRGNFKKLGEERKSELYFALFGKDNPEPAAKPQKVEQPKTAYQIRMEQVKARKAQQAKATPAQ
jgi:hypothetical protein